MSTFDTDFAASAIADHFAYYGREVTFLPAEGPPRTITAILTDAGQEVVEGRILDEEQHGVWLEVRRDESHADGGISSPGQGDAFRHPDEAEDSTPFTYQGQRRNENPDTWELLFARNRLDAVNPRSFTS
ncbi:MAG: hypothetical protein ACYSWU_19400 [Planctomycetota bacterium]|jgi:hypothetical protein